MNIHAIEFHIGITGTVICYTTLAKGISTRRGLWIYVQYSQKETPELNLVITNLQL